MLIAVPDLLSSAEVADIRAIIDAAEWVDGNATSGHQSALAKQNEQLPEDSEAATQAGRLILEALGRSPLFFASALPLKLYPRSEERRVGKECVRTCRSRWWPYHKKKKKTIKK